MVSTMFSIFAILIIISLHVVVESVPIQIMSASKHLPMHLIEVGKTPLNIQRKKRLVNAGNQADDLQVYNDFKMASSELNTLARKRRSIQVNHRRRRSSFYNVNPYFEQKEFHRTPVSNAWTQREAIQYNNWNDFYPTINENEEDTMPFYFFHNEEEEFPEDYHRYPILIDSPYDNLQLQREYNIDIFPLDDEEVYTL